MATERPATRNASAEQPIRIRLPVATDTAFILSTWLRSYVKARPPQFMTRDLYYFEQARLIKQLLARSKVLVAADPEISDAILGWAVGDRWAEPSDVSIVHYVYVKADFHGRGVGRALLQPFRESKVIYFTHMPPPHIRGSVDPVKLIVKAGAIYNPYLAFPR